MVVILSGNEFQWFTVLGKSEQLYVVTRGWYGWYCMVCYLDVEYDAKLAEDFRWKLAVNGFVK